MKRDRRAFKVLYNHKFMSGAGVAKSDYYETSDGGMIDSLIRSQGALEVPLRSSPPIPDAPLAIQPEPGRLKPEVDEDVIGEKQPDWDFRTISDMKAWLSACGLEVPTSGLKAAFVELCRGAWKEGLRPSPFWGLPGGPAVAPGLHGPDASSVEAVEDAIATAEAAGVEVPEVLLEHLESLLAEADDEDAPKKVAAELVDDDTADLFEAGAEPQE